MAEATLLNRSSPNISHKDGRRAGTLPTTEAGKVPASDGQGRRSVDTITSPPHLIGKYGAGPA